MVKVPRDPSACAACALADLLNSELVPSQAKAEEEAPKGWVATEEFGC